MGIVAKCVVHVPMVVCVAMMFAIFPTPVPLPLLLLFVPPCILLFSYLYPAIPVLLRSLLAHPLNRSQHPFSCPTQYQTQYQTQCPIQSLSLSLSLSLFLFLFLYRFPSPMSRVKR